MITKQLTRTFVPIRKLLKPSLCNKATHSKLLLHSTQIHFGGEDSNVQSKQFSLSFDEYQQLKRSIRTKQRIAAIPFAFGGITAASMTMAYLNPDMFDSTPESVQLVMGLDPLVFTGITGCVSGALGYVLGVNVFKALWARFNRETANNLHERDTDFLQRLDKYRFEGDSKFEDDFYGESIKSLSDYRQWVRTHQKKRETSEKFKIPVSEKLA